MLARDRSNFERNTQIARAIYEQLGRIRKTLINLVVMTSL